MYCYLINNFFVQYTGQVYHSFRFQLEESSNKSSSNKITYTDFVNMWKNSSLEKNKRDLRFEFFHG